MPKTRRSNGEGSFSTRADGRVQASIRIDGRRYTVYGDTRQEAYNKLQTKIAEIKEGKVITPVSKITVREYLLKYLEIRVDYKPVTLQNCGYVLKNQIISVLGDVELAALCLDDVQRLMMRWKARGLKGQTIRDYLSFFRTALNCAVETKLIQTNPCDGLRLPRVEKPNRAILCREHIAFLLDLFKGHWFKAIFILFLATGMRKGELLALKWEDIDLEKALLYVRSNAVKITGRGMVEGTPKTKSSERTIALASFAIETLKQQRIDQDEQRYLAGEHWVEHGLVFTRAWCGDHVRSTTVNYALSSKLKKANIPHIIIHGLRHTTASQLLSMRINPKVVQELLGHASVQMTIDLYGHCLPAEQEQAMAELNDAFWGKEKSSPPMVVKMAVNDEVIIEGEWCEVACEAAF